jgi:hypothetical protein
MKRVTTVTFGSHAPAIEITSLRTVRGQLGQDQPIDLFPVRFSTVNNPPQPDCDARIDRIKTL